MKNTMTWEQKLYALNKLTEHVLIMREPGDWYVKCNLAVGEIGSPTLIHTWGDGINPADAVCNHWHVLVDQLNLPSTKNQYILNTETRKAYRWDEFMWAEIDREL